MKNFFNKCKPTQFAQAFTLVIIMIGSMNILISAEYSDNDAQSNSNFHELSIPTNGHVTCYEVLTTCGTLNYDVYFCNGCSTKMCSSYSNPRRCVVSATGGGSVGTN